MKSARFINIVVRFSLIFAIINLVFSEALNIELSAGAYLLLILITFLCSAFLKNKKVLTVLCIIAEFVPFIFVKSLTEMLLLTSAVAYSIYYIIKENSDLRYGEFFDEFKKSLVAALVLIVIGLANPEIFKKSCAIYLFIFLVSSILLLRVLRNLEFSKDNAQIHRMNIIYGISVFVLTFILRIDIVRTIILKALGAIYYVIAEAISAFAYVLGVVVITFVQYAIRVLIKLFGMHYKPGKQETQNTSQLVVTPNKKTILQSMVDNPTISIILKILLIIAVVYIFIRLFSAKRSDISETVDYTEEKEHIKEETDKSKKSIFARIRPKGYKEQIRYMYCKLMRISIKKEVALKTSDTTLEINKKAQSVFEKSVLKEIREIYIKIRYSPSQADKKAVEKMEDCLKKIK